jgi:hypothetical protein
MANESTNRSQALANPPHALVPTTTTMRKRIVLVDFETCICDVDQSVYEGFHAKMASKNVPFSFQTRQHRQLWENYQGDATKAKVRRLFEVVRLPSLFLSFLFASHCNLAGRDYHFSFASSGSHCRFT